MALIMLLRSLSNGAITDILRNRVTRRGLTIKTTTGYSYAVCQSSTPLEYAPIGHYLNVAAETEGDRTAVVHTEDDVRFTYSELNQRANELGTGLLNLGLRPGDRVGMLGPSSIPWIVTQFAAFKTGLILVNINPAYRKSELEYALRKVDCRALVTDRVFKTSNYYDMLAEILPVIQSSSPGTLSSDKLPELRHVIMTGDEDLAGTWNYSDVTKKGRLGPMVGPDHQIQPDDPVNIQFTSGTTGYPKAATLSHFNLINNAHYTAKRLQLYEFRPTLCCPVPMYHCFAQVLGCLATVLSKGTFVLPARGFNSSLTLKAIDDEKCDVIHGTPTMFIDMLRNPLLKHLDTTSLRTGLMAGSTCPEETMRQLGTEMNCERMCIAYGMTETAPASLMTSPDDSVHRRQATVGFPLDNIEVKVVDADNRLVETGETGEICTRGHNVMLGYWEDEPRTRESTGPGHWWRTGDLGVMQDDGYMKVVGRIKDVIIRGGENVYPAEVEQCLHDNVGIEQAQVVGVPCERLGEEVCAWVIRKHGVVISQEEVRSYCKERIAHMKVPKYVYFTDEFPLTVTGKVLKNVLKERAIKNLTTD